MDVRPAVIAACIGAAVFLQGPIGQANAARRVVDFRFVPETSFAKVLAFGHTSSAANIIWLGALPDMSRQFKDPERRQRKKVWLKGVLDTVTDLEPSFATAYLYGSDYLWLASQEHQAAIKVLQKGVARNPENTWLIVKLGMAHFHANEKGKALHYLRRAANRPDCDGLTKSMLAAMEVDGREDEAALYVWIPIIENARNDLIRELAERNFEIVKKKIVIRARDEFKERHGRLPSKLDDLREEGLVQETVHASVLDPESAIVHPDGKLEFPRLARFETAHTLRSANHWRQLYYNDNGRFPTLEQIIDNQLMPLGPPPAGKRWALDDSGLVLVDADGTEGAE